MPDDVVQGDEDMDTPVAYVQQQDDEPAEMVEDDAAAHAAFDIPAFERETDRFWGRLRALFFGSDRDLERRLRALNQAIAGTENTPTNYVLRGELYLELGAYDLALADFEYAEKLATYQLDEHNWGFIAQAMRDRAQAGKAKAKRHANNAHEAVSEKQIDGHEPHEDSHNLY
jgi:tetratricopeptide (TPR) repeat protein